LIGVQTVVHWALQNSLNFCPSEIGALTQLGSLRHFAFIGTHGRPAPQETLFQESPHYFWKGGTADLPAHSSLLYSAGQKDSSRDFICVTLRFAWVTGRYDLKKVPTFMQSSQPFSWKNARILIADDEPDMREIFAAWFRNQGCSVSEAADGRDALDALARDHFDAIVTDVRMPRLDGVQLVRQLGSSMPYIPVVIFVSGYVDLTLADAFDLGIEAVLSKPCEKKALLGAVQRSLLRRDLIFDPADAVAPPSPKNCVHESFPRDVAASHVAIGRGGLSLNVTQQINPDCAIRFFLSFAEGPLTHLEGWGLPRWTQSLRRGSRIGIEFLHLEPESLRQLASWLKEHSPVSFIPKDCLSRVVTSRQ
jgi:CheY-like chemotaxis protein